MTLLADTAAGAPSGDAVMATLVLSGLLRLLHDGPLHQAIALKMLDIDALAALMQRSELC